jgi:hypothetical protein
MKENSVGERYKVTLDVIVDSLDFKGNTREVQEWVEEQFRGCYLARVAITDVVLTYDSNRVYGYILKDGDVVCSGCMDKGPYCG